MAEIISPSGAILRERLLRWTALLIGASLFLVLARYITKPIRTLQNAATRIADGDLSVRVLPSISPRGDEIAELARDFDRMADRVQGLLERQQKLLADISHELRSPLTRLSVSLELLRRGEAEGIERMQSDVNSINALIQQILTLSRLQVETGDRTQTIVSVRSLVESVAADADFEGQEQRKAVVITRADDCWTKGDPALLRSCIENVVRNAVRHTRPETNVEIVLNLCDAADGNFVHVVIADHGAGVPADALSRLFEPFYRVPASRDVGSNSSGLGLSIAQRVAALHGGTIAARNRERGGLVVDIALPGSSPPPHGA